MVYVLKMEYVYKINIFGLKMMMKSGLEKIFWNPSMREDGYFYYWICDFGHFYEVNELSSLKKALHMEEFQKYFF